VAPTIQEMTTRERLHKLVDELSEQEALRARVVVEPPASAHEEAYTVGLPEALRRFDSGREQPDWVSAIRRSRNEH
jgi:hypothetical protein